MSLTQTSLAAAYVPPGIPPPRGLPVPRRKHIVSEHLSQKRVSEGSAKEKNLLIRVTDALYISETT